MSVKTVMQISPGDMWKWRKYVPGHVGRLPHFMMALGAERAITHVGGGGYIRITWLCISPISGRPTIVTLEHWTNELLNVLF